jgi:DNA mismatch repair protein MSH3
LLPAFSRIAIAFPPFECSAAVGFKSALLNGIFYALPLLREPVQQLIDAVVLKKAAAGNKAEMWVDPERYPEIADADGVSARGPIWHLRFLLVFKGYNTGREGT